MLTNGIECGKINHKIKQMIENSPDSLFYFVIDNDDNKDFSLMGDQAIFWTTTEFHNPSVVVNVKDDGLEAYSIVFDLFSNFGTYYGDLNKGFGFSVRCFKK